MVHRIQNRNPGYSDFSNSNSTQSFTFSNPNNSIITNGANALKIEEEIKSDDLNLNENISDTSTVSASVSSENESLNHIGENENIHVSDEVTSNGLENFDLNEEETPELFNSDNKVLEEDVSKISDQDIISEDDDLEIPAFLRRQKN